MKKYFSKVKTILTNRRSKSISDLITEKHISIKDTKNKYISAAILFPLIERNNKIFVILTKRSEDMNDHPGQVCFPGGKYQLSDKNMENCAKREAFEEIGIEVEKVKVLGELDICITGTGFHITPIVALIDKSYFPKIDKREVMEVFEVPLNFLLNFKNRNIILTKYNSKNYSFYEYNWGNKKIWGSTAKIIVNFCDIIKYI